MQNPETRLQNQIMSALSMAGCYVERSNHGVFYTKDARRIRIGNRGQSDIRGHRSTDGRAFYIEIKTENYDPTDEQLRFLECMKNTGALAGVARTPAEALSIVGV